MPPWRRIDLDDRTLQAELVSAQLAVSLFSTLVTMYERAREGTDPAPLKLISVAANTLGAYLKKGPVLQPNIYSAADPQVTEAQISLRVATAQELHHNVRIHLDTVTDLGTFLEFEAVLGPAVSEEEGRRQVERLRQQFGLATSMLVTGSYADLG